MKNFCSNLTFYMLIGWVGFIATISMVGSLFVDWAVIFGWITIITTTIVFYVTTIEAEYVECEWASFITIPSGLVMMFAGVFPVNIFVAIAGPIMLAYAIAEIVAPRYSSLARLLRTGERRARARAKREARLLQLEQERQRLAQQSHQFNLTNGDFSS